MNPTKKKKATKVKECQCTEKIDEILKEYNACLVRSQLISRSTGKISLGPPQLMVEKIDTKKKKATTGILLHILPDVRKEVPKITHA